MLPSSVVERGAAATTVRVRRGDATSSQVGRGWIVWEVGFIKLPGFPRLNLQKKIEFLIQNHYFVLQVVYF